jgi:hypothetical protein
MSAKHSGLLEYLLHQTIGLQIESSYSFGSYSVIC